MTIRHHPDDTLLMAHASGSLDGPMRLILATHLYVCPQCRGVVALAEQIGGFALEDIAPAPLAADASAKILARLDRPDTRKIAPISNDNTPLPLRAFLGRDLSEMRWRRMGPNLGYVTLYRRGTLSMRLLRGTPGSNVGRHTHRGMEYTQVLRGGYTDTTGSYEPGDFQIASDDVKHNPIVDSDGDCINLSVTTGPLRFDDLMQKIVGGLFGF